MVRTGLLASHEGKRGDPDHGRGHHPARDHRPTLLWAPAHNRFVLVAILATLWTGAIGFVDDYLKVVEGKPRGLVARWKLVGQVHLRARARRLSCLLRRWSPGTILPATATVLPFVKYTLVSFPPVVYVLFVTFVVTGSATR